MKIKKGVSLTGLQIEMRIVLKHAEAMWKDQGQECVITAGTEVVDENLKFIHSAGSYHPFGYALDFRTYYFSEAVKNIVTSRLKTFLGFDYDVVVYKTHIHVEYDPK